MLSGTYADGASLLHTEKFATDEEKLKSWFRFEPPISVVSRTILRIACSAAEFRSAVVLETAAASAAAAPAPPSGALSRLVTPRDPLVTRCPLCRVRAPDRP